jgi:hypothetical protein
MSVPVLSTPCEGVDVLGMDVSRSWVASRGGGVFGSGAEAGPARCLIRARAPERRSRPFPCSPLLARRACHSGALWVTDVGRDVRQTRRGTRQAAG